MAVGIVLSTRPLPHRPADMPTDAPAALAQCLVHTQPFNTYLLKRAHGPKCARKKNQFCSACALEELVANTFTRRLARWDPNNLARNLGVVAKDFRLGRQEDAH